MKHIVQFSGGAGSWAASKRVAAKHGTADLVLLFCDTYIEDDDLYRFLLEGAANVFGLSAPQIPALPWIDDIPARKAALDDLFDSARQLIPGLVRLADGRTPHEVYRDARFLGNSRVAHCSTELKQALADAYVAENFSPTNLVRYIGLDWSEGHRFFGNGKKQKGFKKRMAELGWQSEAPLLAPPYLTKPDMLAEMKAEGLKPPRMYEEGFAHNNCGGRCCKAGITHWAHMLLTRPAYFALSEGEENELRDMLGDVSMLSDRAGAGGKKPLPLTTLRKRIEAGAQIDMYEIGGCGCFTEE